MHIASLLVLEGHGDNIYCWMLIIQTLHVSFTEARGVVTKTLV